MPDLDPMAEALASLPVAPPIRRGRSSRPVPGSEKLNGVQPDLLDHWNSLQSEFESAGLTPEIKSGFRTAEQQNYLHTHGYPTKGNDGYINISPHQEGRALDVSFPANQKAQGRAILTRYAQDHGLYQPSDEPWHIAIPKQGQQQPDRGYSTPVNPDAEDQPQQPISRSNGAPAPTGDDPMANALASLSDQKPAAQRPITTNDAAWHLGMTPDETKRLSQKTISVLQDAVAEDERKKAAGESIAAPSLRYQNQMRDKAGLKPLKFNVATNELAPSPYYKPQTGALPVNPASPFTRTFNAPQPTPQQRFESASVADPERDRIRQEVIAERGARQQGPMTQARAALALGDAVQPSTAVEDEVTRRYDALQQQRAVNEHVISQFTDADKAEIADFANHLKNVGQEHPIYAGVRTGARSIGSGVAYKIAGALDVLGGRENDVIGNWLRRKALAGEISVEDVKKELPPSRQREIADFLAQSGLGLAEVMATPGGPIGKFAGLAGAEAIGRGRPAGEVLTATGKGAAEGALFRGAEKFVSPAEAPLTERLGTSLKRAGVVGIGTTGVELATGTPLKESAQAGLTNALYAGGPTAIEALRGSRPESAAVRSSSPEAPAADPMAEALSTLGVYRSQEPDAGPAQFRGLDDGAVHDLATGGPIPKGTSRSKRQQIAERQIAARAELQRRQDETPMEIIPPDTGLRADTGDVPSFRDYVENRPQGGIRFDTLEPGSPDFNQLAGEYVARYGTRARAAQPAGAQQRATQAPSQINMPERPAPSPLIERAPETPTTSPVSVEAKRAREILVGYEDTGDLTEMDVVSELERKGLLPAAVAAYRNAQVESRSLGHRMDVSGETFEKDVLPGLRRLAEGAPTLPSEQIPSVSAGKPVDLLPIQKTTTQKELNTIGGQMLIDATTNEELAQIQKAMQKRAGELSP